MDIHTFANLIETPTLDQVELKLLTDYFEHYLEPYIYEIELDDGQVIRLKFNRDNFCHLIGAHKPAEKKFGQKSGIVYSYKGNKGYKRIKSGKITKSSLKNLNKSAYKDMRDKIVNFYLIHRLLDNPEAAYYTKVVNNVTSIDILIYKEQKKSYIHLGIIKKDNQNYYVASTFLIEPITANSDGKKFVEGQTPINIRKITKETQVSSVETEEEHKGKND